jgi:hypothetical protein
MMLALLVQQTSEPVSAANAVVAQPNKRFAQVLVSMCKGMPTIAEYAVINATLVITAPMVNAIVR